MGAPVPRLRSAPDLRMGGNPDPVFARPWARPCSCRDSREGGSQMHRSRLVLLMVGLGLIGCSGADTMPCSCPVGLMCCDGVCARDCGSRRDGGTDAQSPDAEPRSITISPSSAGVAAGASQQFTANRPVRWQERASDGLSPGMITAQGLYTPPLHRNMSALRREVIATSLIDPDLRATAQVWVKPEVHTSRVVA